MLELKEFPLRGENDAPSELAYFHDQKGSYHDPQEQIVNPFTAKTFYNQQREEYLGERKDVKKEIDRIRIIVDVLRDDPKGLKLLGELLDSCQAYYQSIVKLDTIKRIHENRDGDVYKMEVTAADKFRTGKHTALLGEFAKVRRYVMKHYGPDGDIDPHDQDEVPATVMFTGLPSEVPALPDRLQEERLRRKAIGRNA